MRLMGSSEFKPELLPHERGLKMLAPYGPVRNKLGEMRGGEKSVPMMIPNINAQMASPTYS